MSVGAGHLPRGLELTQLDSAFLQDPHERLDRLRAECPVYWDEDFRHFFLTRRDDVRQIMMDRSLWRDPDKSGGATLQRSTVGRAGRRGSWTARIAGILQIDDPDHSRIRAPLAIALNRRTAAARPTIERLVDARLDGLQERSIFDLVEEFSIPIPVEVIGLLIGVRDGDLALFRSWADALMKIFHPAPSPQEVVAMARARREITSYLTELMAARRAAPKADLVSDLLALQAEGAPISDDEIRVNCQTLIVAATISTCDFIGNAVWLLLSHPEVMAEVRQNPRLIGAVMEETLRLESPVDITVRIASTDMEVRGCPIARAETMTLSIQAANRDPAAYHMPHRFDIHRSGPPHIAFGGGARICIGQHLARLEAQIAISRLITRFPTLRLQDPSAPPSWRVYPFFHGLADLTVVQEPA